MENHHPDRGYDYKNTTLVLILATLLGTLGVVWSYLGLGAALILGAVLNHLVTRLEVSRARRKALARFDRQDCHRCDLVPDDR